MWDDHGRNGRQWLKSNILCCYKKHNFSWKYSNSFKRFKRIFDLFDFDCDDIVSVVDVGSSLVTGLYWPAVHTVEVCRWGGDCVGATSRPAPTTTVSRQGEEVRAKCQPANTAQSGSEIVRRGVRRCAVCDRGTRGHTWWSVRVRDNTRALSVPMETEWAIVVCWQFRLFLCKLE